MKALVILSVPRSGSTWLGKMFDSSPFTVYRFQPNMAYSFEGKLGVESSDEDFENFKKELYLTQDPFVAARTGIDGKEMPQFPKTEEQLLVWKEVHSLYLAELFLRNPDTKVIGLIRSPFSVISSWLSVKQEFDPSWSVKKEWREGDSKNQKSLDNYFGYEKWKEACHLFIELATKYPGKISLCSYENLISDTEAYLARLFEFTGLPVTTQTSAFLRGMQKTRDADPYSINRTVIKDDAWKKRLPNFIIEEIRKDEEYKQLQKIFKWVE